MKIDTIPMASALLVRVIGGLYAAEHGAGGLSAKIAKGARDDIVQTRRMMALFERDSVVTVNPELDGSLIHAIGLLEHAVFQGDLNSNPDIEKVRRHCSDAVSALSTLADDLAAAAPVMARPPVRAKALTAEPGALPKLLITCGARRK